eukprot:gene6795-7900_t
MVSKILPGIVQRILGNYIEGLDSLSIPFWKGEIVLENLKIKKEVFESDLPFELVSGVIKRVVITVPWLRFLKDKISVQVDGVFMLFGRKNTDQAHACTTTEKPTMSASDIQELQAAIEGGATADDMQSRMAKALLRCLQMRVTNVHICYQDRKTSPGEQFSVGVTVEALNFETTDQLWIPVPAGAEYGGVEAHKLASFFNVSVYWDSQFGVTKLASPDDMEVVLLHSIPRQRVRVDHKYIIEPLSGFVKMRIAEEETSSSSNNNNNVTITSFDINVGLKQVDIRLLDIQYRDMLNLLFFMHDWRRIIRYKSFRPTVPLHGNTKAWWQFAYRSIISDIESRKEGESWNDMEIRKKTRECYIKMYREKLFKKKITSIEEKLVGEIEKRLTYEDVILTIAEKNLEETKKNEVTNYNEGEGWWRGGWFGLKNLGWGGSDNENGEKLVLSNDELMFLEKTLALDLKRMVGSVVGNNLIRFKCNIKKTCISILDWQVNNVVVPLSFVEACDVDLLFEMSTITRLDLSVSTLQLIDKVNPRTKFESLIVDAEAQPLQAREEPLFKASITINGPEDKSDWSLSVELAQFYMVNSKPFVDTMIAFFTDASQEALDTLKYSFLKRLRVLQEQILVELKHLIRNQKAADIHLNIAVPGIIFPEAADQDTTDLLVISPGLLELITQPINQQWDSTAILDILEEDDEDEHYAKYKTALADRVQWWRDHCQVAQSDTPLVMGGFFKSKQIHQTTLDEEKEEAAEEKNSSTLHSKPLFQAEDWHSDGINVNNSAFYEGISLKLSNVMVRIIKFSQPSKYRNILSPCHFTAFIQLCSDPFNLDLAQIMCHSMLSSIKIELADYDLYSMSKIVGKNGLLEYVVDMDHKSSKELSDMYDVVSSKKPKRKGFDLQFSLFSDRQILHARKKTKELLTHSTLLKFVFQMDKVDFILRYDRSEALELSLSNMRIRCLAKFLHMEVIMDLEHIQITDTNSIIPVLSIFPCPQGSEQSTFDLPEYPVVLHLTSISKNSLEYDYIDFIASLSTQCVRFNLPKECVTSLTQIVGKTIADANKFHERKKSILTIEGSRYKEISTIHHSKQHRHRSLSERLDVTEFDPNDLKTKLSLLVPSFTFILCSRDSDLISLQFDDISIAGVFQLPLFDVNAKEWGYNRVIAIAIGKIQLTLLFQTINMVRHYIAEIDYTFRINFPTLYVVDEDGTSAPYPPKSPMNAPHSGPPPTGGETTFSFIPPQQSPVATETISSTHVPPAEVVLKRKSITNLDITIDGHQLILPKSATSRQSIQLRVGKMFLWLDQTDPLADVVRAKIHGINVGSFNGQDLEPIDPIIQKGILLDATIIRRFETSINNSELRILMKLDFVQLKLSQYQYNLLYNVFKQNINQSIVPAPISSQYSSQRLQKMVNVTMDISDGVELNLEDENTKENKFFSLTLDRPMIYADFYNNGDVEIAIALASLAINDKNEIFGPKFQEIIAVSCDELKDGRFQVIKLVNENGVAKTVIDIDKLHMFIDLEWIDKLTTFLLPLADPDTDFTPLVISKVWKLATAIQLNVKQANLMIGSLTDPNGIVLLLSSEVVIDMEIGSDGLLKIRLAYKCHKGLLSDRSPQVVNIRNRYTTFQTAGAVNNTVALWTKLKKTAKLFIEAFHTNLHICLVPEGNQFYFCELDRMMIIFSGRAYRYLLELYETFQNILYLRSKPKENNRGPILHADIASGSGDAQPVVKKHSRRGSLQSSFATLPSSSPTLRMSSPNLPIPPISRTILYDASPSTSPEKVDSLYHLKTRSAEMIRTHQTRLVKELQSSKIQKKPFTHFSMSLKNIEVLFVDDLSKNQMNTPLFNFKLAYGFLKIMLKTVMEVDLDCVITLDYFNNRIAFWEPFIEPWQFKCNLSFSKELSIELTSNDLLNINFTIPLMDNLSLFLITYSQEFGYPFNMIAKPPVNDEPRKEAAEGDKRSLLGRIKKSAKAAAGGTNRSYAPFFVRNQTGSKLRYRLETHDGKQVEGVLNERIDGKKAVQIEGYGTFFDLLPGESMPVKFSPDVQVSLETFNQLVLSVELLGIEKTIGVPLDKLKVLEYPVVIDSSTSSTLLVSISIKKGTKNITIRFPVVFQNLTSFSIDVATLPAGFGGTQPPNLSGSILQRQTRAPIPINRMKNALIKIKPTGDTFKWSRETIDMNDIKSNLIFTSTTTSGDQVVMFRCFVKKKGKCFIVKLCPMLKVKNLLPYPITYRLRSRMLEGFGSRELIREIEAESKVEVYDLAILDKFRVQIKMDESWSEEKVISEKNNLDIETLYLDFHGRPLHLNMEYESENGIRKILFYNQYWVFNKTGLNLYARKSYNSKDYKDGTVSFNHNQLENTSEPLGVECHHWYEDHLKKEDPIMFSFKKAKDMDNSIRIRVGESVWSNKLSIAAIGDRGCITVLSDKKRHHFFNKSLVYNRQYQLGISIDIAPNLKTKIIVIAPRFIFFNDYPYGIIFKQLDTNNEITVQPGEKVPLYYFVDIGKEFNFICRLDFLESEWTNPFSIMVEGDYAFRMYKDVDDKRPEFSFSPFIKIQPCLEGATLFIIATQLEVPPYKISNMTQFPIMVLQKKVGHPINVAPRQTIPFVWDQPMGEHVLEINISNSVHTFKTSIKVDKIKTFKPMEFHHDKKTIIVRATVNAEESTRVLTLTDSTYQISIVEEEELSRQTIRLDLKGLGVSLINSNPSEILYVSMGGIHLEYYYSSFFQKIELRLKDLQVDNQLSKVTQFSHPVLLFAENNSKNLPFLHVRLVKSNKMQNIDYFHEVFLSMQELNIRVEEDFLYVLLDFFNSLDFSFWTGNKKTHKALHNVDMLKPIYVDEIGDGFVDQMLQRAIPSIHGKKMYFETLSIDPLSLYLTFDLSKSAGAIQRFTHAFGSNDELLNPLVRHYMSEGLSEVYKILGTFNFLGNPAGLFKNFGIGFKEFFVNTGRGIVRSDFREGVTVGSKSLAKHTVYGIFDSGTKFTASAAKVLSTVSMDKQYIMERQYIIGECPSNIAQGFVLGSRIALISVQRSLTGIVQLPYYGGKEGGAIGAIKGIGKGIAGVVVKPLAGGFDFMSKFSEGIKNSTHLNVERNRVRYPRPIFSDMPLKVFDDGDSFGHYIFLTNIISGGKLGRMTPEQLNMPVTEIFSKDEKYVSHLIYRNRKTLLFTNNRLIYLKDTDGFRTKFDVKYADILNVMEEPYYIRIKVNQAHKFRVFHPRRRKSLRMKCSGDAKHFMYAKILDILKTYRPMVYEGICAGTLGRPVVPYEGDLDLANASPETLKRQRHAQRHHRHALKHHHPQQYALEKQKKNQKQQKQQDHQIQLPSSFPVTVDGQTFMYKPASMYKPIEYSKVQPNERIIQPIIVDGNNNNNNGGQDPTLQWSCGSLWTVITTFDATKTKQHATTTTTTTTPTTFNGTWTISRLPYYAKLSKSAAQTLRPPRSPGGHNSMYNYRYSTIGHRPKSPRFQQQQQQPSTFAPPIQQPNPVPTQYQQQLEHGLENIMRIQQMQIQQMHQLQANQIDLQNILFQQLIQDKTKDLATSGVPPVVLPTAVPSNTSLLEHQLNNKIDELSDLQDVVSGGASK